MYCYHKLKFWMIFSVLLILGACTEEFDITSEMEVIEEPKIGETFFLRGTVRDTSEQGIESAALRIQFDDYVEDLVTDLDGNFEIELPQTNKSGLIVTGKPQYNRSIQSVNPVEGDINKDIYLVEENGINQINLDIDEEQLFYIRGRFIDQFGDPIPDVLVAGESETVAGKEIKYGTKTDQNGNFEFITEQADFEYHFYFAGIYVEPCWDNVFGFRLHTNDTLLALGDLVFPISATYEIFPKVELNGCKEIDYINHIYRPGTFAVFQEELLPDQSFTYCDTNITSSWIYNGVFSRDGESYNGQYLKNNGFSNTLSYDLCTPEGRFLELSFTEDTLMFEEFVVEGAINNVITGRTITVVDGSNTITIKLSGSFSSSTNGGSYNYTRISSMTMNDTEQNTLFTLGSDGPNLLNLVGGNNSSKGVGTGQIEWADGRTEFVNIRIRL